MSTKYIPIRTNDGYYGPTQFTEVSPALAGLLASLPPWPKPFKKGERERWLAAFKIIIDNDYSEDGE